MQLSSIAPQVSIPPTPPPPLFHPSASNVRVNVFWFMALAFSLLAAFLALLVQQWVRDYMYAPQRYGDPLKSARLRQYLYEGYEKWYMPLVAEAVPGSLHVSLFLFFLGLADSLLSINTQVAISTIFPIGISGLLYIFSTLAPIIYPQSPYKNTISRVIWYLFQKYRRQTFKGRDGKIRPVSRNMSERQMQLAMEETMARKERDARATQWLIDNLTEDAEMEKLLSAMPGSFNTKWGTEVWKTMDEDVVHKFSARVARSVEMCKNRTLFSDYDSWRRRTRACIEVTASLVCCANAKIVWFEGLSELLGNFGRIENIRRLSLAGTEELFVTRWTCLSLVAIRPILEDKQEVRTLAKKAMTQFLEEDDTGNHDALASAQKIDETLQKARDCLFRLYGALQQTEGLTEEVEKILRGHKSQISELAQISIEAGHLESADQSIFDTQHAINFHSHEITSQIPGVLDDLDQAPLSFSRFVELSGDLRKLQFIRPMQTLKSMSSPSTTLRNIPEGQGDAVAYKELMRNLKEFTFLSGWQGDEMRRQLWRLWDLNDGGGLGFTVELFFIAFSQLLSPSSPKESHSALYTGTFRAITSDWRKHKASLGTQNLLLNIIMSRRAEFNFNYPAYIVDEFLLLLGNVFEGQTGPHIDEARQKFESFRSTGSSGFGQRVLTVLTRSPLS